MEMSNSLKLKLEMLQSEIREQKEQNTLLESQAQKLREELNFVINYSQDTKKSIFKIRELEEANFDLKSLQSRKQSEFKQEKRSLEVKYESEINKLKTEISLIYHKYDTMMRYETYMKKIEEENKELSEQIKEMEVKYASAIAAEARKYEIQLGLVQQKTLGILGESKKNIQTKAMQNMNNSFKLVNMQVTELHHQLSEQSVMLEDLLKELNKKEKQVQSLKINISVYKEVEKSLVTQNRRLSKMMKRILESKKTDGEAKQYMLESKKFINIMKNEQVSDDAEDSFAHDENSNSSRFNSDVKFNNVVLNGNISIVDNFDPKNFSKRIKAAPNSHSNSKANINSLVNKEKLNRINLVKNNNIYNTNNNDDLFNRSANNKKVIDSADKLNAGGYMSDYCETANRNLLSVDYNTIISNNNNKNSSIVIKSNSKNVSNDNIFAKFLRNTFNNFPEKSSLLESNNIFNNNKINNNGNNNSNRKNNNKNSELTINSNNKQNLMNVANRSMKSNMQIPNNVNNIPEKNISDLIGSSKIKIKEESNTLEASASKGDLNTFKGKSYNNSSSLLDDMNSTMEFGNTFVKNSSFNNFNLYNNFNHGNRSKNNNNNNNHYNDKNLYNNNMKNSVTEEKDNLGFSEVINEIEAKSNSLSLNNAVTGQSGNTANNSGNNNLVRENEIEVDFEENRNNIICNKVKSNGISNINYNGNSKDVQKKYKKGNFSVMSKVDKMLKNSKYARNNQILEKYEAELMKMRENEILGIN